MPFPEKARDEVPNLRKETLRRDCQQAQRSINQDRRSPISDRNERLKANGILLVEAYGRGHRWSELSTALAMLPELERNEVM